MSAAAGPLAGLLVLDFATLLPGPLATLILAEAGAEVVKVERPGTGDEMRGYQPAWGADSANFALLNRGKRSVALDLKDPAQRARLDPLIERADILVEQFRPGVMERLGLGPGQVMARNPRLIWCSITGYGQSGPKRDAAGHDLNYIGDAGLLSLGFGDAARPVVPPALIADIAGGAYPAVMNILMALHARQATGRGQRLDIAMTDNLFPFLYWAMGQGFATGRWPGNGDGLVTGGTPRYRLYPTADGRVLAAAPIEDRFWAVFCDIIGLEPQCRDDARDPAGTAARVAALVAARDADAWRAAIAGRDCCCSIVATVEEAMNDPHFAARGLFGHRLANAEGQQMPALPVPLAPALRCPPGIRPAPALGADNAAVLAP
ncbi:CaiB/BaiF CoA transferase family protein [Belnapia rosea]|uniref:Crotonobetainyl-CoA:carnitine CoA-transferase CaiB n=2 Tax=Belnapia rosea TaxID=938405 RepID=A0A1G7DV44_9PROT|nr:CaiB/BaiF CoA-transferase family protein [Belnapia rosea]SDE55056.1 Crotonobetainyl-CoA:carnitine CoA-transferase CaiB [Belnapia rosea]